MIWLTWRQFRLQAWTALTGVAIIAALYATTGGQLANLYQTSGIPTCAADGTCDMLRTAFLKQVTADPTDVVLYFLGIGVLYVTPAIIGMFWGAPLVAREIEGGTLRLSFSQSITRTRWLTVKLAVIALVTMATVGLLSLVITWWASPIDKADGLPGDGEALPNRFVPIIFGARDVAPIGYAAFAFVLGVAVGLVVRRTLPAMAITLAAIAAVQVVMPAVVRPHLITPVRTITAFDTAAITRFEITGTTHMTVTAPVNLPGAWIVSAQTIDAAGHPFTGPPMPACLTNNTPSMQPCTDAVAELHLRQLVTYQPANRYWTFQWLEMLIYLVLAGALAAMSNRLIRRLRLDAMP